jgi:hypothetical protein
METSTFNCSERWVWNHLEAEKKLKEINFPHQKSMLRKKLFLSTNPAPK